MSDGCWCLYTVSLHTVCTLHTHRRLLSQPYRSMITRYRANQAFIKLQWIMQLVHIWSPDAPQCPSSLITNPLGYIAVKDNTVNLDIFTTWTFSLIQWFYYMIIITNLILFLLINFSLQDIWTNRHHFYEISQNYMYEIFHCLQYSVWYDTDNLYPGNINHTSYSDLCSQVNIIKYCLIYWQFAPEEITAVIKTRRTRL